jgi:hypothetical protein
MSQPSKQLPPVQRQSIKDAVAEAESKGLEYHPKERATYIRTMLQDIALWMSQGDSNDAIQERVPQFVESYPELFKKIITRQDLAPIQNMLNMLDKMGEGNLSQHQASIQIGKTLVDRYVTPQLNGVSGRK